MKANADCDVMEYPQLLPGQVENLLQQCWAVLAEVSGELADLGCRLVSGLTPQQWRVEWHLPWWLASSFGLPEATWQALTVCNLLGLGYVWIQDHLAESPDGIAPASIQSVLASALYESALARMVELFTSTPAFWQMRRAYMAQWLCSLLEGDRSPQLPFAQWQAQDFSRLAWRGAPLKITATGACLLAGRIDAIQPVALALDHLLVAEVLLDHAEDWRDDLVGERFNALVACASDALQTRANIEINQRRVLTLLMIGNPKDAYFRFVEANIVHAREFAVAAGCGALVAYVTARQAEARTGSDVLVGAARMRLQDAAGQLLASTDGNSRPC